MKMATAVYTEEQLNYFRICHIVTDILPQGLRLVFKQEWDSRYKATLGEWNDTPKNGLDFKNGESPAKQTRNARLLATMIKGNREEWDCTMLFYAILYSDSIYGLKALIQSNVDDLREFRNEDFAHMPQGKLSELKFRVAVRKVEIAFKQLGLSTVDIQTVSKQKSFPTDELQNVMKNVQKLIQDLQKKDAEVQDKQEKLQISEEQRLVLEDQLLNEAESFCVLPPKPPHPIAARDWEVAKVKQELSNLKRASANSLSYCYISGNPGSGKSQLAGLVAKTFYEEAIKDTSASSFVMTLSAESPEALMKSYVSLARKVGCPEYTVMNTFTSKDMTTEEKIDNLKDSIATKIHLYTSWLLVVDNVTSVACTRVFLPEPGNEQWGKGQLLITTQDSSCIPLDSSSASHISISKGMDLTDASCFLAMVTGITDHDLEAKVCKALDYQPLAIASAGTYVKQVRNTNLTFGWKDYLEKLEQGKRALTENALAKSNASYPNSMTVATKIAVERVMNSDEVMKHAFTFLALCAPELIKLDILTNYILNVYKEGDKEEIGIQIQGSSLLLMEKEQDGVYLRLHQVVYDMVKLLVKDCMETDNEVQAADAAIKSFTQYIYEATPGRWIELDLCAKGRRIVQHLKTLAVIIRNIFSSEEKYQFFMSTIVDVSLCNQHLRTLGVICTQHSEFSLAVEYLNAAIRLIGKSDALDEESNADLHKHFTTVDCFSGKLQPKQHYERALPIPKKKIGPENVHVARTYLSMGNVQSTLGNHQLAMEYYERALSIQKEKLGPEHVDVASTYDNLGNLQRDLGNHQLAMEYYERALSIRKKKLGPEHVDVARTYNNLGNLQLNLGNHQLAMEYYERALSIRRKKLGPEHVDVARTYNNLGNLQRDLGNHQLAKEHYERALSIQKKKLGPEHVDVGSTYNKLGNLQRDLGNHQLAMECYERALSIRKKKLGPEHVDVARTYNNLGNLQRDLGNHQLAKEHYERALSIKRKKLGPEHVDVARTYNNLGNLQRDLGNYQLAKEHYERALSIKKKKLGPEHVDVARTYNKLGNLQRDLGNHQLAMEYYERAISIRKKKLGPEHVDVASTHHGLGVLQGHLGKNQLAKEHFELALSIRRKKLGHNHVDVMDTHRQLSYVQRTLNDLQQVREHQDDAMSIQPQKRKPDDVDSACMDRKKHQCDNSP